MKTLIAAALAIGFATAAHANPMTDLTPARMIDHCVEAKKDFFFDKMGDFCQAYVIGQMDLMVTAGVATNPNVQPTVAYNQVVDHMVDDLKANAANYNKPFADEVMNSIVALWGKKK